MNVRRRGQRVLAAVVTGFALLLPGTAAAASLGGAVTPEAEGTAVDAPPTDVVAPSEPAPGPAAESGAGAPPAQPGSPAPEPAQPEQAPPDPGPAAAGTDPAPAPQGPEPGTGPATTDPGAEPAPDPARGADGAEPGPTSAPSASPTPTPGPVATAVDDRLDLVAGQPALVDVRANDLRATGLDVAVGQVPDGLTVVARAGALRVTADDGLVGTEVAVRYTLVDPAGVRGAGSTPAATSTATLVVRVLPASADPGSAGTVADAVRDASGATAAPLLPPAPAPAPVPVTQGGLAGGPAVPGAGTALVAGSTAHRVCAVDDDVRTRAGRPVVVAVLANDTVVPGVTVSVAVLPQHGSAVLTGTQVEYVPAPGFEGHDSFVYVLSRGGYELGRAVVRVSVAPAGDLAAVDDEAVADSRGAHVAVLANDLGADGATVAIVQLPRHGAVSFDAATGLAHYDQSGTPTADTDEFVYSLTAPDGTSDTARVLIHLALDLPDDEVVAVDDLVVAFTGDHVVLDPRLNDHGASGWGVRVEAPCRSVDDPEGPVAVDVGWRDAGTVLRCTYWLVPPQALAAAGPQDDPDPLSAVITVVVHGTDAVDDDLRGTVAVARGGALRLDVLANDTVPDSAVVVLPTTRTRLGGHVESDRASVVTYTPPRFGHGVDSFTYEVRRHGVLLDTATVLVTVVDVPSVVRGLRWEVRSGEVELTWAAPRDDGGTPVVEYRLLAVDLRDPLHPTTVTVPASSPTHTWTGLTNGRTYLFVVSAVNAAGTGLPRAFVETVRGVPDAPGAVTATAGDRAATVSWTAPASDGGYPVTSYRVSWEPTLGTGSSGSVTVPASGTLSTDLTGLDNGVGLTVSVRASNRLGEGPAATTTVTPHTVPTVPLDLRCPPVNGTARCTWAPPADDGGAALDGYVVRWRESTGGTAASGQLDLAASALGTDLPGLTPGLRHVVEVSARNVAGEGPRASVDVPVHLVVPADDTTVTGAGTPVDVDVLANDTGIVPALQLDVLPPATGAVVVAGRTLRVTPDGSTGPVDVTYLVRVDGVELVRALLRVHVVDAVDDAVTSDVGVEARVPVLTNDLVDGVAPAALPADVVLEADGPGTGVTARVGTGDISVTPTAPTGGSFPYRLVRHGMVLDRATVTVTVPAVVDTTGTGTPGTGTPGTGTPGTGTPGTGTPGSGTPERPRTPARPGTPERPVTPQPPAPTDELPRAVDDAAETPAGTPVTVDVLRNDVAGAGATLDAASVRVSTVPASGTATVLPGGAVEYRPREAVQDVTDRFAYTVRDSAGHVLSASVSVRVGPLTQAVESVPMPGGSVTLEGEGCRPGESVRVAVGGAAETVAGTADADGRFAVDVVAPEEVGRHRVEARCGVRSFVTEVDVVLSTSGSSASAAPAAAGLATAGLLAFYLLSGSVLAPRGTSVPPPRGTGG